MIASLFAFPLAAGAIGLSILADSTRDDQQFEESDDSSEESCSTNENMRDMEEHDFNQPWSDTESDSESEEFESQDGEHYNLSKFRLLNSATDDSSPKESGEQLSSSTSLTSTSSPENGDTVSNTVSNTPVINQFVPYQASNTTKPAVSWLTTSTSSSSSSSTDESASNVPLLSFPIKEGSNELETFTITQDTPAAYRTTDYGPLTYDMQRINQEDSSSRMTMSNDDIHIINSNTSAFQTLPNHFDIQQQLSDRAYTQQINNKNGSSQAMQSTSIQRDPSTTNYHNFSYTFPDYLKYTNRTDYNTQLQVPKFSNLPVYNRSEETLYTIAPIELTPNRTSTLSTNQTVNQSEIVTRPQGIQMTGVENFDGIQSSNLNYTYADNSEWSVVSTQNNDMPVLFDAPLEFQADSTWTIANDVTDNTNALKQDISYDNPRDYIIQSSLSTFDNANRSEQERPNLINPTVALFSTIDSNNSNASSLQPTQAGGISTNNKTQMQVNYQLGTNTSVNVEQQQALSSDYNNEIVYGRGYPTKNGGWETVSGHDVNNIFVSSVDGDAVIHQPPPTQGNEFTNLNNTTSSMIMQTDYSQQKS